MEKKTILIDKNYGAFCGSLNGSAIFNATKELVDTYSIYRVVAFDREKAESLANGLMSANYQLELECVDIENAIFYKDFNGWYVDIREIAKQGHAKHIMGMIQNIPNANMETMH